MGVRKGADVDAGFGDSSAEAMTTGRLAITAQPANHRDSVAASDRLRRGE
jgi:hypothetical protein